MALDPLPKAPEFRIEEDVTEKTTFLVRYRNEKRAETIAFFMWSRHGRQGAFQVAQKLSRELVTNAMEKVA